MAMLAETRQRKRYNLVPRGKALYEDDSRFGTKMLEKMGWKRGQGLGAQEDGSKDFIRIRYKNDALGLGFEERDDQWTQHEHSFNGLLNSLNNEGGGIENEDKDKALESEDDMQARVGFQEKNVEDIPKLKVEKMKEKISGVSLEERSKQSKARVHYKKFTKGKDLAQYSEKDLANIFGKKSIVEHDPANNFLEQSNDSIGRSQENLNGVQIINTGVSINDYFKAKIEKGTHPENATSFTDKNLTCNGINSDENTKEKRSNIEEENAKELENKSLITYSNLSINDYFKKKMSDLKNRKNGLNTEDDIAYNINSGDEAKNEDLIKKKKKKKSKIITGDKEVNDLRDLVEEQSKKDKMMVDHESVQYNTMKYKTYCGLNATESKEDSAKRTSELHLDDKNGNRSINNENKSKKCDIVETAELRKESKEKKIKSSKKIQSDPSNANSTIKKRKCDNSQKEIVDAQSLMEPFCVIDLTHEKITKKKHKSKDTIKETCSSFEPSCEVVLTQEPPKKKKKKNKSKETIELIDLDDKGNDVPSHLKILTTSQNPTNEISGSLIVPPIEMPLLRQEPAKKKKKKDKAKNTNVLIELDDKSLDATVNSENQTIIDEKKKKNKSKKIKEVAIETTNNDDNLTIACSNDEMPEHSAKPPKESKRKNVSSTSKSLFQNIDFQILDIDEIRNQVKSFDIYPISSFCAEKFRNLNMNNFKGSTLPQINGYGLGPDLQLDIQPNKLDEERITNLWKCVLNKYGELHQPKNTYREYVKKFHKARNAKIKFPKLNVKIVKRKNLFQTI